MAISSSFFVPVLRTSYAEYIQREISTFILKRQFHQLIKDNDKKLLKSFFKHPTPSNIQWGETEQLLKKLGAILKEAEGSRIKITLDGQSLVFHKPHGIKGLGKAHVATIRLFLQKVGLPNPEE